MPDLMVATTASIKLHLHLNTKANGSIGHSPKTQEQV